MTTPRSAWRWLAANADDIRRDADDAYYDRVRGELLDMIEAAPTFAEMRAMFADTGYLVERARLNIDGNLPERVPLKRLPSPRSFAHVLHALRTLRNRDHDDVLVSREVGRTYRVDTARLALTGLSPADLDELFSSQIYLVARVSQA